MNHASPPFFALGLIGYPLGHSLSPQLHHAALAAMGLPGEYRLYPVEPLPQGQAVLAQLVGRLRSGELHGLNVTIPHKQAVLPLLDELSPAAQAIGAANTLFLRNGRLLGENTDAPGFLADLQARLGAYLPKRGGRVLLLGAGGSARAVAYALAGAGWQVQLAARRQAQAAGLAQSLATAGLPGALSAGELSQAGLAASLPVNLIVNATPLGMSPHPAASPWPAGLAFPAGAALYDLVYNPRETLLVRQAQAAGLAAASGLGMLVEQAALALEHWTGRAVERAAMYATLEPL
jgi:shikimate dehydrogenase